MSKIIAILALPGMRLGSGGQAYFSIFEDLFGDSLTG
jgi:hypothetical protein